MNDKIYKIAMSHRSVICTISRMVLGYGGLQERKLKKVKDMEQDLWDKHNPL